MMRTTKFKNAGYKSKPSASALKTTLAGAMSTTKKIQQNQTIAANAGIAPFYKAGKSVRPGGGRNKAKHAKMVAQMRRASI